MKGYAALITVMVVGAILIIISTTTSLSAIDVGKTSLGDNKSEQVALWLDSCVEEALWKLNSTGSIPGLIVVEGKNCDVVINSNTGSVWNFTASMNEGGYLKSSNVECIRAGSITINKWSDF